MGGAKKRVWCGLARDVLFAHGLSVDPDLDVGVEAGDLEHLACVGARRHDRDAEPGCGDCLEVPAGPLEDLHAVVSQRLVEQRVLPVSQALHRLGFRVVVRIALFETDAAAVQKGPDAVFALLAVHVLAIVGVDVERDELIAAAVSARLQVGVEHLLPCFAMHACSVGEHTVEVEEADMNTFG